VHIGAKGERKLWRQGIIGDATGAQVFEAIATGRLWINVLHVNQIDSRFNDLVNEIFVEVETRVPGSGLFYPGDLPQNDGEHGQRNLWQRLGLSPDRGVRPRSGVSAAIHAGGPERPNQRPLAGSAMTHRFTVAPFGSPVPAGSL
jgi:hypothetical protein